jgi:very-short-patch-repair endonuclease
LALEIDGYIHATGDQAEKDRRRDDWPKAQGVEVIRINASEVLKNIDNVMDHLSRGLSARSPSPLGGKRHDGEAE